MGALRQPSSSGKPSVAASGASTVHNNKAANVHQFNSDAELNFFDECFVSCDCMILLHPFVHLSRDGPG